MKIRDLTGERFGKLMVESITDKRNSLGSVMWLCVCDCGISKLIASSNLLHSYHPTRSCGCFNRDRHLQRTLPSTIGNMRALIYRYKRGAKLRNLIYDLSEEDFHKLTQGHCFYCGATPKHKFDAQGNGAYIYNGIDRIDNSRGYTTDNVVSCCEACNKAKRKMTQQEFYIWIKRVYKNYKKPASIAFII